MTVYYDLRFAGSKLEKNTKGEYTLSLKYAMKEEGFAGGKRYPHFTSVGVTIEINDKNEITYFPWVSPLSLNQFNIHRYGHHETEIRHIWTDFMSDLRSSLPVKIDKSEHRELDYKKFDLNDVLKYFDYVHQWQKTENLLGLIRAQLVIFATYPKEALAWMLENPTIQWDAQGIDHFKKQKHSPTLFANKNHSVAVEPQLETFLRFG